MNYAYAVSNPGEQWKVIFMVLIVIFTVVKGTLQWNGKSMVYGDSVSCIETNRTLGFKLRDW